MSNEEKSYQKTNINWFPGHMAKALRQIKEKNDLVDIVLELVDSRAPLASSNPVLQDLIKNKYYLRIFTKVDLADNNCTNEYKKYLKEHNIPAVFVDLNKNDAYKIILNQVQLITKQIFEKDIKKGLKPRTIRAMVVGIPNVGKSTLINTLSKRKSAAVGNRPGFTKAQQWIRCKDIDLLDTPGVLWPNLTENQNGVKLALIGSIKEEILPSLELANIAIEFLNRNYKDLLMNRYNIAYNGDFNEYIETFATIRGHLYPDGKKNIERSANAILNDFKNGLIGKISLERCEVDGWF